MPTSKVVRAGHRPGDIVVVPFPYSDQFAEKRRPALVVSNRGVAAEGFVWVVMVTSAKNPTMRHDLAIADLKRTGLSAPSVVRPIKIACIEPSRILRRAGRLAAKDLAAVIETVVRFLG